MDKFKIILEVLIALIALTGAIIGVYHLIQTIGLYF